MGGDPIHCRPYFDYIEIDEQHAIFEVQVPEAWIWKSVGELNVRRKFGITILGIKRAGKTDVSVTPDTILSDDTTILALGEYKACKSAFGFERVSHSDRKEIHGEKTTKHSR